MNDQIKEVQSIESSIKSLKISKNWNDLPVELKIKCIGKMTEKTKVKLSMCSKFDQKIVKSERKKLKMVWFQQEYEKIPSNNEENDENEENEEDDDCSDRVYRSALWTTNMSGDTVLQNKVEYLLDPDNYIVGRMIIFNDHKFLCHFLNNFEIKTLKLKFSEDWFWQDLNRSLVREPKKVENLEVTYTYKCTDLFDFAMRFNPNTIRLCGRFDALSFSGMTRAIKCMIEENSEIGRKIEISFIESSYLKLRSDFGPFDVAQLVATEVNATVLVIRESYFRLALKKNPNKHIIALNRPNKTIEFAVVSKDLAEIPDTFF